MFCFIGPVDGSITKQTEALTGNFDPSSFSDMAGDRKGQELFDTLLGGGSVTNDQIMAYLSALGMIAIPGIIFYVFNLCCCVWCTCCHSCCKICSNSCHFCKCTPIAARPYTKEEKCLPVFFWTVFSLIMFGFAGAGVVNGAYKLNDSLVGAVCLMDDTSLRFDAFLTNVKTPLDQLNIDFKKSVDDLTDVSFKNSKYFYKIVVPCFRSIIIHFLIIKNISTQFNLFFFFPQKGCCTRSTIVTKRS